VSLAEARERRAGVTIIGLSVLAIAVGLLMTLVSARALRPIRQLIDSIGRVSRGDFGAQLRLQGDDDIAILAKAFDTMAQSLKERDAELKRQQEALLRAQQLAAVGRVSAQVAHEVRNPLSAIGLNTEMLAEELSKASFPTPGEKQEAHELLSTIGREVDRLTGITEQYLGMARLPRPTLEPEDVSRILSGVLDFSREEFQRSHIEVTRQLEPECRALLDEGQLRQVFLNLLRNSREAMPEGGQLQVRSRPQDGYVVVTVKDEGRGIPETIREHIFEPFFSTKHGGTGLGLAVTRQILQAHGGQILCESSPGKGTTFVVKLPAA
jgi:signal transduction histidine kinase